MRRKTLLLTIIIVAALLLAHSVPALASPPEDAEGLWQYQPFILGVREAGCNTFLTTFENGIWSGTFSGTSTEEGQVVIHCSGAWSYKAIVTFQNVTVAGKSGTLEMSVVGDRPDAASDWAGKWVILGGTGELSDVRGQGTWWGPGASGVGTWGDIYYAGNIHFDPH